MFISCVTYFEVKGGLLAKNATRKLEIFNDLCSKKVGILYLEDQKILDRASQIYAELRLAGTPVGTADILIAATAIERNLILVSHDRDMLRIGGAIVEDWLAPE
jgi:tRNA(fMet)-specific endonuclease VapC